MDPLPVPEAPEAIVNQEALLEADHVKPLFEAVTASDPDPPEAGTLAVEGLTVIEPKALLVTVIAEGNHSLQGCRSEYRCIGGVVHQRDTDRVDAGRAELRHRKTELEDRIG